MMQKKPTIYEKNMNFYSWIMHKSEFLFKLFYKNPSTVFFSLSLYALILFISGEIKSSIHIHKVTQDSSENEKNKR